MFKGMLLLIVVLVVFFLGIGLKPLLWSPEKKEFLAMLFQRRSAEELSRAASERLAATLAGLGVTDDGITKSESRDGGVETWKVLLPSGISALQCNLAITRGLRGTGVRIADAVEEHTGGGTVVTMKLEARKKVTHLLELRQVKYDKKVATPLIAIVVDNLGGEGLSIVDKFISLPVPLTFLVLPGRSYSEPLAQKAVSSGKEVFVDVPMEPKGYPTVDPGKGAIYVDLPSSAIRKIIRKHLSSFPYAKGISNHMGSLATQDRKVMTVVLNELRKGKLVFLDNQTTPNSIVGEVAGELEVPCLKGGYVLDDRKGDLRRLRQRLGELERVSFEKGQAIGTVRIVKETLSELEKWIPQMTKKGVKFVTLSELVK
ncbi:MAG: divergent polysaccharide deacetylase family protein [Candidatus Eisenbacteria bacterium]|nr:divergent polysaccharide deacetylase family protein [Candidatus Eisenbacteria bacterium]